MGVTSPLTESPMKNMHAFVDLFAGIGGFRVSLQKLGMKCVFSCEIDPYARESYQKNFDDHKVWGRYLRDQRV